LGSLPVPSRQRYGGTRIRAPQGDTIAIFVHGVLSDGEQAWMNDERKSWPALLAENPAVSNVRVNTFSYWTKLLSSTYSMGDVVDSIQEYFTPDDLWGCKNMIFVCHSMGSVAARRTLSALSDDRDKMRTI
jgi:hypothetical protein